MIAIPTVGELILAASLLLVPTPAAVGANSPTLSESASGSRTSETSMRASGPGVHWEPVPLDGAGDAIHAVAVDARGGFAVGDERGVLVGPALNALRRHSLRSPVRFLSFLSSRLTPRPAAARTDDVDESPALLVATEASLYRAGFETVGRPIAPAPGERAAVVSRIAIDGPFAAIATADGVFLSADGLAWRRLGGLVPSGPASSVALRAGRDELECWAAIRGQLWRVVFGIGSEQSAALSSQSVQTSAEPHELPSRAGGRDVVDIVLGIDGVEVAVVFDSAIVVGRQRETGSVSADIAWEVLRPDLPPGASIIELGEAIGWYWLATDRGLLRARELSGPWAPANGPLATRSVRDLTVGEVSGGNPASSQAGTSVLYVATDRGLMVGTAGPTRVAAPRTERDRSDPGIDQVHRAALHYLDLGPGRIAAIDRGLDVRGWLPEVGFSIARDKDRYHGWDYDEAFLSGGLRKLRDTDHGHSNELQLRLSLSWDLGDIAYHPERLDIAKEAREIIELRDEVLDEVTQLYFERQRVLGELHALEQTGGDALALEIRAEQLAAGIDAWTGGWFSGRRHAADANANTRSSRPATPGRSGHRLLRNPEQRSPQPGPPLIGE